MAFKMSGPWLRSFLKQKDYNEEGYGDQTLIEGAGSASGSYVDAPKADWSGIGKKLGKAISNAAVFAGSDEGHLKRDKRWAEKRGFDPTEFVEEEGFEFSDNSEEVIAANEAKNKREDRDNAKKSFEGLMKSLDFQIGKNKPKG